MSRKFQCKVVPSVWIEHNDRRLDCGPYVSGAIEARELLARIETAPLNQLTKGYHGGIYNGSPFVRNYVEDPEHGVPFLTTSSLLQADLSNVSYLSKRDAQSRNLSFLEIKPGMSLITCSGSIGRIAYARADMNGMWSNQDIMKVVPDPDMIRPGYVYAYLSGRFGVPLVVSGTYGAVIQHIEPRHIMDLPVPMFGELETKAHDLVYSASRNLAEYQSLLTDATAKVFLSSDLEDQAKHHWLKDDLDLGFAITSEELNVAFRSFRHSRRANRIKESIRSVRYDELGSLIDLEWLRWRVMFKRITSDPEFGIEVITQKPLFNLNPEGKWISREYLLNHSPKYVVPDETILIAKQGTLGEHELYCRCEFITGPRALARAYSDHCMRIVVKPDSIHPGYLFAFLRSESAFRMLRSLSEGSKQQDLHWRTVPTIPVPRSTPEIEAEIGEMVRKAFSLRNSAIDLFDQARSLVENAIEESAR